MAEPSCFRDITGGTIQNGKWKMTVKHIDSMQQLLYNESVKEGFLMDELPKAEDYEAELLKKLDATPASKDHLVFEKEQRELRAQISENYHTFVYNR